MPGNQSAQDAFEGMWPLKKAVSDRTRYGNMPATPHAGSARVSCDSSTRIMGPGPPTKANLVTLTRETSFPG